MDNICKYIQNNNHINIINELNDINKFYIFIREIQLNLHNLNSNKIEYILKIIFNKIIYYNGNVQNENFYKLYDKLQTNNEDNANLLNTFISYYDKYLNLKEKFLTLNINIIDSFKNKFNDLNKFSNVNNLSKSDLNEIKNIIDDKIFDYFNSFFEIKYNKYFFKRITDSKTKNNQEINSNEMLDRLLQLVEIFKLKLLNKLNIEIITVSDFKNMEYLKKVEYFRIFYNKTNIIFKLYYKIYDKITNLNEKINDLISIDELNYFDILNDSSSSGFVISEEKLEIDMNPFDQNYSELECSELSFSEYNSDDDVDTPIFKESNELNQNDDNSNSIDDLFIKN